MHEKLNCILVDWTYAYDLCKDVGEVIKAAGFQPEVIIGVARGGWFLARVLCDFFLLKDLFSLKMEHWGLTATITGDAEMKYGLDEAAKRRLKGKKVLIADDVTDTGDSINLVAEYVQSLGVTELKTATMHHKTTSSFTPDFYGELIRDWKWVIYPWSIHEDVMELTGKVLAHGAKSMSLVEIRSSMKEQFDFYVPCHQLKQVLENMAFHGKIRSKKEGRRILWQLC
ncbi:MAG: phosphoribosyltransferase [Methanophagales archaeon ANME-1-THS]|nr:MAG: phosphoribosyltransferase [Methanophagales archaeon ANME-1-THS]